ncbi:BTB/POZ domain-containing protein 6-like [Paramacrobiotus metropolitanus]|uniref:BTB/POZ domain-containing protein 6-like n=1 Tax=Paramacrobiotus metropolitanus TaxID=2943436 RepID=UPI002446501F|nr:BTB/POZ domain-containing protein 6-like [Paramacrobiotus metropolitanus]
MSLNLTASPSDSGNRDGIAKISDGMQLILTSTELSDVQFAVGRDYGDVKTFLAHRLILSIRSDVFDTMFYGSVPETCSAPIDVPDIHPEAFANMLSYIYTDAVKNLSQDNVFHTLGCADKYDLPLLVAICVEFALKELKIQNCLDMLDSAVLYASVAPSILEKCLCLIDESVEIVWKLDQFCAIGYEALRIILQRDMLTANEDKIYSAVEKWTANMCKSKNVGVSPANRREIVGRALYLIRFPLLTDTQLLDGPVQTGLLLQSEAWDICQYKHAVIKPDLPFPTESRQNVRSQGVINYTIPDLRELSEASKCSDPISVRKLLWNIEVVKRTDSGSATLGFYLECSGDPECDSWKYQVTTEFRLLPWKTGTTAINKQFEKSVFDKKKPWAGTSRFASMKDLLDPAKGYVNPADFSLKLQVHLTADLPGAAG